jgi:hypothetical protein
MKNFKNSGMPYPYLPFHLVTMMINCKIRKSNYQVTPTAGSQTVTMTSRDLDGARPNVCRELTGDLLVNTTYSGQLLSSMISEDTSG